MKKFDISSVFANKPPSIILATRIISNMMKNAFFTYSRYFDFEIQAVRAVIFLVHNICSERHRF